MIFAAFGTGSEIDGLSVLLGIISLGFETILRRRAKGGRGLQAVLATRTNFDSISCYLAGCWLLAGWQGGMVVGKAARWRQRSPTRSTAEKGRQIIQS